MRRQFDFFCIQKRQDIREKAEGDRRLNNYEKQEEQESVLCIMMTGLFIDHYLKMI